LSPITISALAKGSNFAVAPNKISKKEIISQIEIIYKFPSEQADNIRIHSCYPPQNQATIIKHNQTRATRFPRFEQGHGYYRTSSRQRQHYSSP